MAVRLNLSSIMNKLCSISCYQGFVKHEIDIPIMQQDPVTYELFTCFILFMCFYACYVLTYYCHNELKLLYLTDPKPIMLCNHSTIPLH